MMNSRIVCAGVKVLSAVLGLTLGQSLFAIDLQASEVKMVQEARPVFPHSPPGWGAASIATGEETLMYVAPRTGQFLEFQLVRRGRLVAVILDHMAKGKSEIGADVLKAFKETPESAMVCNQTQQTVSLKVPLTQEKKAYFYCIALDKPPSGLRDDTEGAARDPMEALALGQFRVLLPLEIDLATGVVDVP
ncbi:MAG: hypothetical protein V1798_06695 [Pseudomonadota bacterium]